MTDSDEQSRILAACDECGAVYAAIQLSDGTALPIGSRDGCRCGSTTFSRVTEGEIADPSETGAEAEPKQNPKPCSESDATDG